MNENPVIPVRTVRREREWLNKGAARRARAQWRRGQRRFGIAKGAISPSLAAQFLTLFEVIGQGNGLWRYAAPCTFRDAQGREWTVPTGYVTNLYSMPSAIKWMFGDVDANYGAPAGLHDYLYDNHVALGITRAEADEILWEAMRALGMRAYEAWIIYRGVRLFGQSYWDACETAAKRGVRLSHERFSRWIEMEATR